MDSESKKEESQIDKDLETENSQEVDKNQLSIDLNQVNQKQSPHQSTARRLENDITSDNLRVTRTPDEKELKNMSTENRIKVFIRQLDDQVRFMDFKFEEAFHKRDKDFMIAYGKHIKVIQQEIDLLKSQTNDKQYKEKKQKKIQMLESKLSQIKKQALFLGDMSEMHQKSIKQMKLSVDEKLRDKVFLQEQIVKCRNESFKYKSNLKIASQKYDELYYQAQQFLKTERDPAKVQELLKILEEQENQSQFPLALMAPLGMQSASQSQSNQLTTFNQTEAKRLKEKKPNQLEQQAHLGPGIVKELSKYNNVKLVNFIEYLYEQQVSVDRFAAEIEKFFLYHSIKKTKIVCQLQDQIQQQEDEYNKLVNDQKMGNQPKEYLAAAEKHTNALYQLFVQKFEQVREDIRTRKTFNMLANSKSLKIRTDQIQIPESSSITPDQFKPADQKLLIDLFVNDEEVQERCQAIIQNRKDL